MLLIGWVVLAVLLAVALTSWVTFTLTRLDRLHARVDAAEAALDAQLVRRAVAVQRLVDAPASGLTVADRAAYAAAAQQVLGSGTGDVPTAAGGRQALENAVGRAVTHLLALPVPLDPAAEVELREAAARVLIARRFYNDAVRDTRALRARRMPRLLHLAGHRGQPDFFDIDDTLPPAAVHPPAGATLDPAPSLAAMPLDNPEAPVDNPEEDR
ncbi:hypothetical protein [uncultured Jatrophihabitans sp.]|uniref:hypothetical protein n=1 Tax=uncultured Jatrophihabitans sp. TaxID=1610747 RepID=UPI0035CAB57D